MDKLYRIIIASNGIEVEEYDAIKRKWIYKTSYLNLADAKKDYPKAAVFTFSMR